MSKEHAYLVGALAALAMVLVAILAALGSAVPSELTNAITATTAGLVAGGILVAGDGVRQASATKADRAQFKNNPAQKDNTDGVE